AEKAVKIATLKYSEVKAEIATAKKIQQQRQFSSQLRQLLLRTILDNLHLWSIGRWGGGVPYHFDGHDYRIPHGVMDLISSLSSVTDHKKWIENVMIIANDRDQMGRTQWKYTFFHVRNENTTGALYHVIKQHLHLEIDSLNQLQNALAKIEGIQGVNDPLG